MPHLSALSLALNRPGAVSLEQVVASLFANNEQGAWYDPSAANVTWRRNLLTYTEDFSNAAWTKTNVTATADLLSEVDVGPGNSVEHFVARAVNFDAYAVLQVELKASGRDYVRLFMGTTTASDSIRYRFSTNTFDSIGTAITGQTATDIGGGWVRFRITKTASGTQIRIALQSDTGAASYVGDPTKGVLVRNIDLRNAFDATVLPAYQRIVTPEITYLADVQSQPLLFQDSTGATPVTAVEQPVGLILDKRKGLVLGPDIVTNGTFDSASNWTLFGTGATISGGVLTVNNAGVSGGASQSTSMVTGKYYQVTFTAVVRSGTARVLLGAYSLDVTTKTFTTSGTYSFLLQSGGATLIFERHGGTIDFDIDNVTLKLLDGNHAYQTGSASRPVLRARYNLLTYSEQLDLTTTGGWTRTNIASVTANAVAAPDGTTTADKVVWANATTDGRLTQAQSMVTGATYTMSAYVKAAEFSKLLLTAGTAQFNAAFNLATQSVISSSNAISPTITAVAGASGWYRVSVSGVAQGTGSFIIGNALTGDTGDGTSGIYIWGADLRVGTSAGDYQRIAAATDYATTSTITGQPFRPYLNFDAADGTGDWLQAGVTQSAYPLTLAAGIENLAASSSGGIMSLAVNDSVYKTLRHITSNTTDLNDREASNLASSSSIAVAGRKFVLGQFETSAMTHEVNTTNTNSTANTNAFGSLTTLFVGKQRPGGLISDCKVYGALAINRVLTAGEKSATQSYMASKMGVTL